MDAIRNEVTGRRLAIGAALLAIGGAIGAGAALTTRPPVVMAPAAPTRIAALAGSGGPLSGTRIVTVRGRVAERFGGDFVLDDGSGRVLVDGGREARTETAPGQVVSVQGRYDDGRMRPMFLVAADGSVTAIGPRHGPGHRPGRGLGPRDDGPMGERDAPPPPPPADGPPPARPVVPSAAR